MGVQSRRHPPLRVWVPEGFEGARDISGCLTASREAAPGSGDYVLVSRDGEYIEANQLRNALLCISFQRYDYFWIRSRRGDSHVSVEGRATDPPGTPGCCLLSRRAWWSLRRDGRLPSNACGRVALVFRIGEDAAPVPSFPLVRDGLAPRIQSAQPLWSRRRARAGRPAEPVLRAPGEPRRPTVFVLPTFLAVGGVERNLIEVMRHLHHRYRFVVVTTEPLRPHQGSLHHEVGKICEAVFDLGECARPALHLTLLDALREAYRPDLVWLCNGSPWLLAHANAVRELFSTVPIVDQQIYDDSEGWIRFFSGKGFRRFDRYVAINQKIERRLVEDFRLPPDKIDLIRHGIDDRRFNAATARRLSPGREADRGDGYRFLFVGRLTSQKRPLDFLDLARRAEARGYPDEFCLVGDGELDGECANYLREHELARVTWRRHVGRMEALYAETDGLVVTSAYEGLPLSVLEALSMGVPVFATDVGEIGDLLGGLGLGETVAPDADGDDRFDRFLAWRAGLRAARARALAVAPSVGSRYSAARAACEYSACWDRARREKRPGGVR